MVRRRRLVGPGATKPPPFTNPAGWTITLHQLVGPTLTQPPWGHMYVMRNVTASVCMSLALSVCYRPLVCMSLALSVRYRPLVLHIHS